MANRIKISVIVPVHDQASRLHLTLASLACQKMISPNDYEVIVVDDNSSDDVSALVEGAKRCTPHLLRMVTCDSNGARGVPRNKGAEAASGDLILFLDADALPSRELIARHLDAQFDSSRMYLGDIYVLSAAEFLLGSSNAMFVRGAESNPRILALESVRSGIHDEELLAHAEKGGYPGHARWHRQLEEVLTEGGVSFAWMGVIPHNLSLPRAMFFGLDGFDASLPHMEGWEFGIRALRAGYSIGFAKGARSFHLFHEREWRRMATNVEAAETILCERYPETHLDLLLLWLHAALGDPNLPRELNLGNWRAVKRILSDPERRVECRRLRKLWTRLQSPISVVDYFLGTALNSPFVARD